MTSTTEVTDYRQKWILKPGDTLHSQDVVYTITGAPIGYGGTAVLYPATKSGSHLHYAIKECFPEKPPCYHRQNGIIRSVDPDDEVGQAQLEKYREMLSKEQELGQEIRNTTMRAVVIWETLTPTEVRTGGESFTNVSGGIFSVLERIDEKGRFFRELLEDMKQKENQELPNIYTTACMMEQVLLALQRVHEAGYLFGDINEANVFFSECRPESNDIGIGHLLDFGASRKLEADGYTAPIIDWPPFSTDGFRPFEIRDNKDGLLRLGKQADVYSAGCLMLRCVVSPQKIKTYGESPKVGSRALSELNGRKIGCTGRALQVLNTILDKATKYDPMERYAGAGEMLEAVLELKKLTKPPEYLLPPLPGSTEFLVEHSRDEEIAMFLNALKEHSEVFVSGVGGIGKSEVAIKVAQQWALNSSKGAYFIHYTPPSDEKKEAMEETVMRMPLTGYKFVPEKKGMSLEELREAEYSDRLLKLQENYSGALIVVDNFDYPGKTLDDLLKERSYGEITSLGIRFLFTTRNIVDWAPEWEIQRMSNPKLLELMRHWCTDSKIADQQLLDLIEAVDGHTLMVELIAKTLSKSRRKVTPEQMLEAMQKSRLSEEKYPSVRSNQIKKDQENTERAQHREIKVAQIYEHLKALFDLSGLDGIQKEVLCCATLLPDSGMDCELFESCLREEQETALTYLLDSGWLKNTTDYVQSIHPLIREICREELQPDDELCELFLMMLICKNNINDYDARRIQQSVDTFANAANYLSDLDGDYAHKAGYLYSELGEYQKALDYFLKVLAIREKKLPSDHPELVILYNIVGYTYGGLRDYEKALEYTLKALVIGEKKLPLDHLNLATSYNNMGCIYSKMGEHEKALEFKQKALAIMEKKLPSNHMSLAVVYSNVGCTYGALENYEKALEYWLKAFAILEKKLPSDAEDLVTSYIIVGYTYGKLSDHQKEWEYYEKSGAIHKKAPASDG